MGNYDNDTYYEYEISTEKMLIKILSSILMYLLTMLARLLINRNKSKDAE